MDSGFEFLTEAQKTKLTKKELAQVLGYERKFLEMRNKIDSFSKKYSFGIDNNNNKNNATPGKEEEADKCAEDQQKDSCNQENHGSEEKQGHRHDQVAEAEEVCKTKESGDGLCAAPKSQGSETLQRETSGRADDQEKLPPKTEKDSEVQPGPQQANGAEVQGPGASHSSGTHESGLPVHRRGSGDQGGSSGNQRVMSSIPEQHSDDDLESMSDDEDDEDDGRRQANISKHLQTTFKGMGGKMKKGLKRKYSATAHIDTHDLETPEPPKAKARKVIPYTKRNHAKQTLKLMTPQIFQEISDSDGEPDDPFANVRFGVFK